MGLQEVGESAKPSKRGVVLLLAFFAAFLQLGLYAARREIPAALTLTSWVPSKDIVLPITKRSSQGQKIGEHPIPHLMAEAEDKFRSLVARQSKTLEEAVNEYRRRYNKEPPKGFDGWWDFLQEHNVKIVDEYDGLMEDLAPFMELSGVEIRRRVNQVGLASLMWV